MGGGGGGGGDFSMNGGNGIERDGAPLILSVSTELQYDSYRVGLAPTQFVRYSFHSFKHSVWEILQVGWDLCFQPAF
jgi:hypothetical protein